MWIVIAACRVDGRLLEPGEPLPDVSDERVERLRAARCIEWQEPASAEPAREEQPTEAEPKAKEEAKPKPRRRRR